jgi:hypothetical protein
MHLTPAGLPSGIPGMGEEIDIAMQHAPQPLRQSISYSIIYSVRRLLAYNISYHITCKTGIFSLHAKSKTVKFCL